MLFCLTTLVASSITKCFGPSWPEVHEAPAAPTAKEKTVAAGVFRAVSLNGAAVLK